jgi:AAA domain
MSHDLPEVIVIRGAPGSGKSVTAKCLAARLGIGVRLEVDTLRAMVIPVDWVNQEEHTKVLSLGAGLVAGFLGYGYRPVIVIDTFSGDKLAGFLSKLRALRTEPEVLAFALVTAPAQLRNRVQARPEDRFRDFGICEKLNADVARYLLPEERLIDNTSLTPEQTADMILKSLCTD